MPDLDFDPDTHTYMVGNSVLPSVTSIIAPMYDFRYVDAETLHAAGKFGSAVHLVCELYDRDDLVMDSVDPALLPYLNAWRRFIAEMQVEVLQVEQRYHHAALGYAGTLDRLLLIQRAKVLADIKSVSVLSPAVGIQLAAYEKLLVSNTEHLQTKRAAVQLCGDGTYRYRMYADPMDWPAFVSLLTLKNWRQKNAA